jgi:hypothetical protein
LGALEAGETVTVEALDEEKSEEPVPRIRYEHETL